MKIIHGARGIGKTKRLVELANKDHGYIVVRSRKEAVRVFHEEGAKYFPLTVAEIQHVGSGVRALYVDGLDTLLAANLLHPVRAVTFDAVQDVEHLTRGEDPDEEKRRQALEMGIKVGREQLRDTVVAWLDSLGTDCSAGDAAQMLGGTPTDEVV